MKKGMSIVLILSILLSLFGVFGVPGTAAGNAVSTAVVQVNLNDWVRYLDKHGIKNQAGNRYLKGASGTDDELDVQYDFSSYLFYGKYVKFLYQVTGIGENAGYQADMSVYFALKYNAKASVVCNVRAEQEGIYSTKSVISIPDFNGENALFTVTAGEADDSPQEMNEACNMLLYATLILADKHMCDTAQLGILNFGFAALCDGHEWVNYVEPATTNKSGIAQTHMCVYCCKFKQYKPLYPIKTIALSKTSFYYNGKVQTPNVTVKNTKGTLLKEGIDYTLALSKGRKQIGQYSVVVTFKGNYSGKKTLYYTINPLKTELIRLGTAKKALDLKWKKVSGVSGYQIQYAYRSDFGGAKKINVKKASTVAATIKNLQSGKTCYVRVRTYKATLFKNTDTVYVYSGWTAAKSMKVK